MKFPRKIPTLAGILLVIAIVGGIVYFTERALRDTSQASETVKPSDINITNMSASSFTVTWTTHSPASGTLIVTSPAKSPAVYYDERDKTGKLGKYLSHSVQVRDTIPNTEYTVTPVSNGKKSSEKNQIITLKTPEMLPINDSGLDPAYGVLKTAEDVPAQDALIYLTVDGGQMLSTLTKPSGTWLIPLNQTRTNDLTAYLPVVDRMNESVTAISGTETATALTDSLNDSPVPDMNLGKEYDFRRQQAKTPSATALALRPVTPTIAPAAVRKTADNLPLSGAVLGKQDTRIAYSVSLIAPKKGAAIPSALPLFQGTGIPGKFVGLSIGYSNPIHASVKISQNGIWEYTPTRNLNSGKQSVTATTVDASSKVIALTHEFTILKSGTQVLGDATPSATIAPSGTVTPTTTLTLSPTESISLTPTDIPVTEPTATIAGETPPVSGYGMLTTILILIGAALLAGGSYAVARL